MKSVEILIDLLNNYYGPLKASGKGFPKTAWLSAFAPVELFDAFGFERFYPESYAAVASARGDTETLLRMAGQAHLSDHVCSYTSLIWGAVQSGIGFLKELAKPQILVSTNNQCGTILFSWKLLANHFGTRLCHIDIPRVRSESGMDAGVNNVALQLKKLAQELEKSGLVLDLDKLKESLDIASETTRCWEKLRIFMSEGRIPVQQVFDSMLPVVVMRGRRVALDYYRSLIGEMELNGPGAAHKSGLKRIFWYGYPFWFQRPNLPDLSGIGAQITATNYPFWWTLDYSGEDPFERLASSISRTFLNLSAGMKGSELLSMIDKRGVDGVVLHQNKSCKRDSIGEASIREMLARRGIPSCMIEADMCNPEYFNKEAIINRLESFVETL